MMDIVNQILNEITHIDLRLFTKCCLVSLGTGSDSGPSLKKASNDSVTKSAIISLVQKTMRTHGRITFAERFETRYYRFNIPTQSDLIDLQTLTWDRKIVKTAEKYIDRTMSQELLQCAQDLFAARE